MSAAEIARERREKEKERAAMMEGADELESCATFFSATGGIDHWKQKWGWFEKSKQLKSYSGIRLNTEGVPASSSAYHLTLFLFIFRQNC